VYGDGSTMDKVVCSDVVFETDESKEGDEVVDVYAVNGANGKRRNGGVMVDKCTAVHCANDADIVF